MSYARMTVNGVWHKWRRSAIFKYFLVAVCDRGSLLPAPGAKLKRRDELPPDAQVCQQCDAKGDSTKT